MADRVTLRHPGTDGEWDCPAAAVDGWLDLGWERVSAGSLSSKSKTDLETYAADHGVDLAGASTKADIVAAIEKAEVA